MGGEGDGTAAQAQVAGKPQVQGDEAAAQQMQVTGGDGGDAYDEAYEYALKLAEERDEKIAEIEGEIAGIAGEQYPMANSIAFVKNYTAILDEVYRRAAMSRAARTRLSSMCQQAEFFRHLKRDWISHYYRLPCYVLASKMQSIV